MIGGALARTICAERGPCTGRGSAAPGALVSPQACGEGLARLAAGLQLDRAAIGEERRTGWRCGRPRAPGGPRSARSSRSRWIGEAPLAGVDAGLAAIRAATASPHRIAGRESGPGTAMLDWRAQGWNLCDGIAAVGGHARPERPRGWQSGRGRMRALGSRPRQAAAPPQSGQMSPGARSSSRRSAQGHPTAWRDLANQTPRRLAEARCADGQSRGGRAQPTWPSPAGIDPGLQSYDPAGALDQRGGAPFRCRRGRALSRTGGGHTLVPERGFDHAPRRRHPRERNDERHFQHRSIQIDGMWPTSKPSTDPNSSKHLKPRRSHTKSRLNRRTPAAHRI